MFWHLRIRLRVFLGFLLSTRSSCRLDSSLTQCTLDTCYCAKMCHIEVISFTGGGFQSLTSLDLSSNELLASSLLALSRINSLETLDLSHNQLSTIPSFELFESLQKLSLANKRLIMAPSIANPSSSDVNLSIAKKKRANVAKGKIW